VQAWRQAHPGYWRKKSSTENSPSSSGTTVPDQSSCNVPPESSRTLQDVCFLQDPVVIGLISMVTGSTLQRIFQGIFRRKQRFGPYFSRALRSS
jgi:hypothetical protein